MQSDDEKTVKTAIPTVDEINARLAQPMKDPLIGTKIAGGRYEILDKLGEGGMSVVYKAKQELVDRIVAIKTLKMQMLSDPNLIKRFDREIKTLSRLNHPNIVTVYDCVIDDNNQLYFVMDYLNGYSLHDLLNDAQREKRISPGRAKSIFVQVCNAVDHAHRNGIVHRDLKPANIMLMDLSGQEFVKVVDFGLAKIGEEAQRLTQTGEVWGSPLYMSPEQCNGHELDARSDIYSLGAVMYESLTGSVPFNGRNFLETIQKVVSIPVPSFAEIAPGLAIPPAIQQIVMRCLAKDPDQRYQTMAELKDAIEKTFPADDEALFRTLPPGRVVVDAGSELATRELNRDIQSTIPTQRLRRDAFTAESEVPSDTVPAKSMPVKSTPAKAVPVKTAAKQTSVAQTPSAGKKSGDTNPLIASIVGGLIVALAFIIIFLIFQSTNQSAVQQTTSSPVPPANSSATPSSQSAPTTTSAPTTDSNPSATSAPTASATPPSASTESPHPSDTTSASSPASSHPTTSGSAAKSDTAVKTDLAPVVPSAQVEGMQASQDKLDGKLIKHAEKSAHKTATKPVTHRSQRTKTHTPSQSASAAPVRTPDDKEVWEGMSKY